MNLTSIALTNAAVMTVLAVAVWAVTRRSRRPAWVHACWVAVLLKLFVPPLVVLPVFSPVANDSASALTFGAEAVAAKVKHAPAVPASVWTAEVVMAFTALAGALLVLCLSLGSALRFRRSLRSGRPAPPELMARVAELARRTGLRRAPRICLVDATVSPLVWGLRPILVVPASLVGLTTPAELDTLLVHELVHLRRRDHWVRLLELGARVVYWWHPAVWWATRQLRRAEEQACDAQVIDVVSNARVYADGLLKTVAFLSGTRRGFSPLTSGVTEVEDLKGRLIMILSRKRSDSSSSTPARWAFALLLAAGLAIFPAWAEDPASSRLTLSAHDEPLVEVLGQLASQTELNWVVYPSVSLDEKVTAELEDDSLDEALDSLLKSTDLTHTRSSNVIEIHPREQLLKRAGNYSGQPITLNVENVTLRDVMAAIGEKSGLEIELPDQIHGNVTMNLQDVAWDLALEVVLGLNNLTYTLDGNVVHVTPQA